MYDRSGIPFLAQRGLRTAGTAMGMFLSFMLPIAGCTAPELGGLSCDLSVATECAGATESLCVNGMSAQSIDLRFGRDLDILFVIDNSASMAPKQEQVARMLANFIQQIDATRDNYHVGVVTADIGTLPVSGAPFAGSPDFRCGTLEGDDGKLQNTSCRDRTQNVSAAFRAACAAHCPADIGPLPRYLARDGNVTNVADPIAAFPCLGLVGDGGCEVQSPLEAMKRALDQHLVENADFLRDGARLAIYFITDQDDCSVQLGQRANLDPASMDCGTANPDPASKCYSRGYHCTAKAIACNEPLDTPGPKTGCHERPDSFLEPLEKYSRFLSALRPAYKLDLGSIWSPSMLDFDDGVTTPYGNGQLVVESQDTGSPPSRATNLLRRGQGTSAACLNPDATLTDAPQGYFGQAQLRLSAFKNLFDPSIWFERSICDTAHYPSILSGITYSIFEPGIECLGVMPKVACNGQPACLVGFVDASEDSGIPDRFMPVCSAGCCQSWADSVDPYGPYDATYRVDLDPKIVAACLPEPADCYCVPMSNRGICAGTAIVGIWLKDNAPSPPGKVVSIRCAGTRPAAPPEL